MRGLQVAQQAVCLVDVTTILWQHDWIIRFPYCTSIQYGNPSQSCDAGTYVKGVSTGGGMVRARLTTPQTPQKLVVGATRAHRILSGSTATSSSFFFPRRNSFGPISAGSLPAPFVHAFGGLGAFLAVQTEI